MIRSFLNVFLPEDEYKRLRVLYFLAEAAFLMIGLLIVGLLINKMFLKWSIDADLLSIVLLLTASFMVIYVYLRYVFSGIEYPDVSSRKSYQGALRIAAKRAFFTGLIFLVVFFLVKGLPHTVSELQELVMLPMIFMVLHCTVDLVSIRQSAKKNRDLVE